MNIDQKFRIGSLALAQYKLSKGKVLSGAELAQILRTNPGVALPPAIAEHMADWFEGKVKERRGRKAAGVADELRILWALSLRGRYLSWLQARRRGSGLTDHPTIDWWRGPPHERASRMAVLRLRLNRSWQHLENLASHRRLEPEAADQIPAMDEMAPPVSRIGDLWQCGRHRLICGDATQPEVFATLMASAQAQMVFTDPPFNMPHRRPWLLAWPSPTSRVCDGERRNDLRSVHRLPGDGVLQLCAA